MMNLSDCNYPPEILKYISQMGEKEKKALEIAKSHLGTSFNIAKSIGYLEWKKTKDNPAK